jgi:hypothetical protein
MGVPIMRDPSMSRPFGQPAQAIAWTGEGMAFGRRFNHAKD